MRNYCFPKKQYKDDIEFINKKFGKFMEEYFQKFITRNLPHASCLLTIYFNEDGQPEQKKYFDENTLNDLEVIRDIRSAGLDVHHINIFFQRADVMAELHIDNGSNPRHATINLPLKDCNGSKIVWVRPDQFDASPPRKNVFEVGAENVKPRNIGSLPLDPSVIKDPKTWDIVDSVDAGQPILLKTDTWHAVDNRGNYNYRFLLGIRFAKNPSFESVVEKLGNAGLLQNYQSLSNRDM